MADVCFDVTGHPTVLAPAIQLVRRLGRVVLLGDTPKPTQQFLGPGALSNSIAILGIHGYQVPDKTSEYAPWSVETMTSLFFDYLLSGRMKVSDLVTNRYSPLQAPEVYQGLVNNRARDVGVIFDWSALA
jgi:threonine dehydrogenase-like Zn-dependent dehydrogenase